MARSGDRNGVDPSAILRAEDILPVVYDELYRLADAIRVYRAPIHSARATSLINDAYVRLAKSDHRYSDRRQFLSIAAKAMRCVLVDRYRAATANKRGSGRRDKQLDDAADPPVDALRILGVNEALTKLSIIDERKARLVELRFFGGLSIEESADVIGLSLATAKREWALARAWLYREIGGDEGGCSLARE